MTKKIEFAKAIEHRANLDSSDNGLSVVLSNGEKEKAYKLNSYLKVSTLPTGDIDIVVKKEKKKDGLFTRTMIYSKDTLFLVTSKSLKEKIIEYFKKNPKENEVLAVRPINGDVYICNIPEKFKIVSERTKNENISISETRQKDELGAYETPSNMYEVFFSAMQKELLPKAIKSKAEAIRNVINDNQALASELREAGIKTHSKEFLLQTEYILESFINSQKKYEIEQSKPTELISIYYNFLIKNFNNDIENIKNAKDELFPFKRLGISFRMALIDPQAGSGKGVFNAGENSNIEINLIGTELRNQNELEDGEQLADNENYNVLTGVNANLHLGDYVNVFNNNTLKKATENTLVYLNPPYTSENKLAKSSVKMLKHEQPIFGLFPTSMENFLKKNINGFIFNISKELTGYKDSKVPNNLLFVVGNRFDADIVEEQLEILKEKGLIVGRNITSNARNLSVSLSANNIEDASKEILKAMRISKNSVFSFKNTVEGIYDYQITRGGNSVIYEPLKQNIKKTKEKLANIDKIVKKAESIQDEIISQINGDSSLRELRIFPDNRTYSKEDKISLLTYAEVLQNKNLLVFYRDNYPEIFNIINNMALEDNINLLISKSHHEVYNLSNPKKPENKDKVTSKNLGLLKLAYFPTSFDISSNENKKIISDVVKTILIDKTSFKLSNSEIESNIEQLEAVLEMGSRIILKTESKINKNNVLKDEVFVIVDDEGHNLAKLDVSLTDFHKMLESKGLFSIDDYVEEAKISTEQKKIVFGNFMKNMENIIHILETNSPIDTSFEKQSIEMLHKIKAIRLNSNLSKDEQDEQENILYGNFAKENNVFKYYEQFVKFGNVRGLLEVWYKESVLASVNNEKKQDFLKFLESSFIQMPIHFYEDGRISIENKIRKYFKDSKELDENNLFTKEEQENLIIKLYETLSEEYNVRRNVFESGVRISKAINTIYTFSKNERKNGKSDEYLYNLFFKSMMIKIFGLMPHQFQVAENFLALSDERKALVLNWEMRAGKTLGFLTSSYFLMLYKEVDARLFLETKNFNDIVAQSMRHLPMLIGNTIFVMPPSGSKDTNIDNKNIFEFIPKHTHIFPNLPKLLKSYYRTKAKGQLEAMERFGFEFEDLLSRVEEKGFTLEYMREKYKDSPFFPLLEKACSNKTNNKG